MDAVTTPRGFRFRRISRAGALFIVAVLVATTAAVASGPSPAGAGSLPVATRLISRDNAGATVKGVIGHDVAISGNGRIIAFVTAAPIVASDTNGKKDVYVRDLWAGTTELVSVTDDEKPVQGDSLAPSLSNDGRFVTFLSDAPNLVAGDDVGNTDVFVRDRFEGTTRLMDTGISGSMADSPVTEATISGDGSVVAFTTAASNIVANDTNSLTDVFAREVFGTFIERVSVNSSENQAGAQSGNPSVSDDGRYVAFVSSALLAGGFVGGDNIYVRDRTNGTTALGNMRNGGGAPDDGAGSPSISGDGKYLSFGSTATNIVSGDTNGAGDVFLRNLTNTTVTRVSLTDGDGQIAAGAVAKMAGLSKDGHAVLFASVGQATDATDADGDFDLFIRNTTTNSTRRVTTGPSIADPHSNELFGALDDSGEVAVFTHALKITGESFDQAYTSGPVDLGPLVSASEFVQQQYTDFLNRSATTAEMSDWTTRFTKGQAGPPALIAALAATDTWSAKRAPLIRLYWAFFLRRPDPSGLTYWLKKYQAGNSLTKIAQSFATSSEFKNRYGTVSNQDYVKKVYLNVFNRQPDANGLAYWTAKLDAKKLSRGAVIVQFSESSEGKRRLAGYTNITLIALGMFGAPPTVDEWNLVYPNVSYGEPQSGAYVAHEFMGTTHYLNRVGD